MTFTNPAGPDSSGDGWVTLAIIVVAIALPIAIGVALRMFDKRSSRRR